MKSRPIVCTMGHPLDADGYHCDRNQDDAHPQSSAPIVAPLQHIHTVNVIHSHRARPRPNTMAFRIRSWDGRDYRTAPVNIYGQATAPVHFPIEWVTGRSEDLKIPDIQIVAEFWYPEEIK